MTLERASSGMRICEVAWARSEAAVVALRSAHADEDDARGTVSDALDIRRTTRHFAAYDERSALVGALRMHPVVESAVLRFGLARLSDELSIHTVTRLVIDPAHRHTAIVHRFYEAVYERARSLGVDAFFADVAPERVMMHEAIGFFRCGEGERMGDHGFRVPMLLDLADVEYLRQVGSPLFATAQRFLSRGGDAPIADRLGAVVEETRPPRRATVTTGRDEQDESPRPSLAGVDEWRVSGVLGRSPRQLVARGMPIGRADAVVPRFHLVVAGTVGVMPARQLTPVAYLGVGDAIVEGLPRPASDDGEALSYVALTECTVASLSEEDMARLAEDEPLLAAGLMYKIMTGLARRVEATTRLLVHDRAPGPRTMRVRGVLKGDRPTVVVPDLEQTYQTCSSEPS